MELSAHTLRTASYVLAALALWLVMQVHLLPTLVAGLLVYTLIDSLAPALQRRVSRAWANWLVVALIAAVVVGLLTLLIFGIVALLRSERANPQMVWEHAMALIERARVQLPEFINPYLPDSIEDIRSVSMEWLRENAVLLQGAGKTLGRTLVHILIGLVLGAMVALAGARPIRGEGPLSAALAARCRHLASAFRDIVFAQVKISAVNTLFTGIFLLLVLPLFGVHLPFAKTLVVLTFLVGLLPVIGNLISNAVIFIVGLSVSFGVGVAALGFLIAIHKFEYFLNARIVGTQISARAWELLIAMLAMEATFGIPGVVAAPIYYAYLKRELKAARLI